MQRQTKSLLDEIDSMMTHRNKEAIFESRATHIIVSAINLINSLRESYPSEVSDELERRLINSIKSQEPVKFSRGIRKINESK